MALLSDLQERTIGSVGAVCVLGLALVWAVDAPLVVKIAATSSVGALVSAVATLAFIRRRNLSKRRREQLRQHRNEPALH